MSNIKGRQRKWQRWDSNPTSNAQKTNAMTLGNRRCALPLSYADFLLIPRGLMGA